MAQRVDWTPDAVTREGYYWVAEWRWVDGVGSYHDWFLNIRRLDSDWHGSKYMLRSPMPIEKPQYAEVEDLL